MHERLREILSGVDGLRLALLFGSQAEDRGGAESDVDLAVLAERPLPSEVKARLIAAVGEATGRPVDLIDLTQAGEPLLGEILRTARPLLERDPTARAELLRRHLFDEADFLPHRRRILEARRRKWLGE